MWRRNQLKEPNIPSLFVSMCNLEIRLRQLSEQMGDFESESLAKYKILKALGHITLGWAQYKSPYILIGLSPCYE